MTSFPGRAGKLVASRSTDQMPGKKLPFPKRRRLTHPSEFDQVKRNGRVRHGTFMFLTVLDLGASPAPNAPPGGDYQTLGKERSFRTGFVTPRRIGGAVVRNRVRRRLREIVRKHQQQILDRRWIVTVARPPAARASYGELEDEWLRLAKRASILAA
jgi:ribonuclease P protein component